MAITIQLPAALRPFAGKQASVTVEGATVREALAGLTGRHAALKKHLLAEDGRLRNFVNVYLNDEDVRTLKGPDTALKNGDILLIVPAIAGGAEATPYCAPSGDSLERMCGGASEVKAADAAELTAEEISRYSRHLILPEVGMAGQKKLKAARVLLVGVGGLGAPAGLYLAAAGVGKLGLVDFDIVDSSNLQRQVLYSSDDVGTSKLSAAKRRLSGLNPGVEIVTHETRLSSANALDILRGYDIVVDGTDNFPTRYLVNDACALLKLPNVYGSIFRFEGQVSVFWAGRGPCYRCLYPEPPPPGLVPSCAEGGVLGVLPGVVGTLQAAETVKLICGIGEPLIGSLMLFDALAMEWRRLKLRKDPACPLCSDNPTFTKLIDYQRFCGIGSEGNAPMENAGVPEVTVEELKRRIDAKADICILDVREPHEFDICRIPGSKLIPLGDIPARLGELDTAAELFVHCRSGARSARAVKFLRESGFAKAVNVAGGVLAWADRIDPKMAKY